MINSLDKLSSNRITQFCCLNLFYLGNNYRSFSMITNSNQKMLLLTMTLVIVGGLLIVPAFIQEDAHAKSNQEKLQKAQDKIQNSLKNVQDKINSKLCGSSHCGGFRD